MRTSPLQFNIMVEFMEKYGDLAKPTMGPHGRLRAIRGWDELAGLLNCEGVGETRTADKWRKVWSDLKNNTKKKAARFYRSATGTGGGPASSNQLTDLELRVMAIIGVGAAVGLDDVAEAGFTQNTPPPVPRADDPAAGWETESPAQIVVVETAPDSPTSFPDRDVEQVVIVTPGSQEWTQPSTSSNNAAVAMSPQRRHLATSPRRRLLISPRRRLRISPAPALRRMKRKLPVEVAADNFIAAEKQAYEIERWKFQIEKDRSRQRDQELQQRDKELQQRDKELQQRDRWTELLREMLDLAKKYMEKK